MQTDYVVFRACENAKRQDLDHKQRRLLQMSMTISRKPVGVRGLKGLSKEPVMLQGFHVPPSRDYGKRKLTLVELRFLLQQRDIDFSDPC